MVRNALIGIALLGMLAPDGTAQEKVLSAPWTEVTVSVRDLDESAEFFTRIAGYQQAWRGPVDRGRLTYWGLGSDVTAEALLLKPRGTDHGYIRLIDFEGVPQRPIRVGTRAWDPGGFFSIMVRVKDLPGIYADALQLGWHAENEPVEFDFGPLKIRNMVLKGPDGINIAAYERLSPPLENWPDLDRISQPFNAMQMVADFEATYSFYTEVLGYETFYKGDYLDAEPGTNNFGLPQNLVTSIPRRTGILFPEQGMETGRVEVMEFVGLEGRSVADRVAPPNLGILAVSYPVDDLDAALAAVKANGGTDNIRFTPARFELGDHGTVRAFTVQAPEGALIEIYSLQR